MKVTALIPEDTITEVKKYSNGKNITDSLIIALDGWVSLQKLKNLNTIISSNPLEFKKKYTATSIRKINRKK